MSTTTKSTASLVANVWMTNQSCSRLAAFLMAGHNPVAPGVSSLDLDKSDMAILTKVGQSARRAGRRITQQEPAYGNGRAHWHEPLRKCHRCVRVVRFVPRTSRGRGVPRARALLQHRLHVR